MTSEEIKGRKVLFLKMNTDALDDFFLEGGDELEGICF